MNTEKPANKGLHLHGPTLSLLIALAAIGALLYGNFIYNFHNAGDLLPYILVILAETVILVQALLALWTILSGGYNPRDYHYFTARRRLFGRVQAPTQHSTLHIQDKAATIDVFIPVYGESVETIAATAEAARNMYGRHNTYILDDGKSDSVKRLAAELHVNYIRRPNNIGSKAGNINYALTQTKGDYFAIFDADFVAKPQFLVETLPFFIKRNIAFVQTPQYYGNLGNIISRGAGYMQSVFYQLIQPGKNRFNAAFCVGTNVIFRRSAIEHVGGIYQESKSEDIWTSLMLHEAGYESVFIDDILAEGGAPETISAYFKQQLRWATGGFEILLGHKLWKRNLTIDQKLQYLSTVSYYLHGMAICLLMILPALHIFFDLSPVNLTIAFSAWLFYYLAFYAMQIVVAFYTMGGFRLETIIVSMASFPIYIKALTNVILKRDVAWSATGTNGSENPFNFVLPQLLIFLFLSFTSVVGVWKGVYTDTFSLAIIWNMINNVVFGVFMGVACKEYWMIRRSGQADKKSRATAKSGVKLQGAQA